jgi:hypothetical protein
MHFNIQAASLSRDAMWKIKTKRIHKEGEQHMDVMSEIGDNGAYSKGHLLNAI